MQPLQRGSAVVTFAAATGGALWRGVIAVRHHRAASAIVDDPSARELEQGNLPPQSQTFVNQRFKYTHAMA